MNGIQERQKLESAQNVNLPIGIKRKSGRKPCDMIGKIYGSLIVISETNFSIPKSKKYNVKCLRCERIFEMLGANIRRHGKSNPKGCHMCFKYNRKHGLWNSPGYKVWEGMIRRCYSKKHTHYHRYGGRGITVCDKWINSPIEFIKWLFENGWEKNLEIDRINNNLGYFPYNCRITTRIVNSNNRSTNRYVIVGNEEITISMASRITGIKKTTIKERLNRGWTKEDACNPIR